MNLYVSDVPGMECCIRQCSEEEGVNDETVCDFPYLLSTPDEIERANMMAAAPDMRDALRAILFQLRQGKVLERDSCVTQARAAYLKAGGTN